MTKKELYTSLSVASVALLLTACGDSDKNDGASVPAAQDNQQVLSKPQLDEEQAALEASVGEFQENSVLQDFIKKMEADLKAAPPAVDAGGVDSSGGSSGNNGGSSTDTGGGNTSSPPPAPTPALPTPLFAEYTVSLTAVSDAQKEMARLSQAMEDAKLSGTYWELVVAVEAYKQGRMKLDQVSKEMNNKRQAFEADAREVDLVTKDGTQATLRIAVDEQASKFRDSTIVELATAQTNYDKGIRSGKELLGGGMQN